VGSALSLKDALRDERIEFDAKLTEAVNSYRPHGPAPTDYRGAADRKERLARALKSLLKKNSNLTLSQAIRKVRTHFKYFDQSQQTNFLGLKKINDKFKKGFELRVHTLSSLEVRSKRSSVTR
jgi:hypothetical protein